MWDSRGKIKDRINLTQVCWNPRTKWPCLWTTVTIVSMTFVFPKIRILGSRTAESVSITNYARDNKESGPATMRAVPSWIFLIVMQMRVLSKLFANGSTSYETTPETLAIVTVVSRIETTTRHPPCSASARWSLMCQCLALTSLTDSHTRHSRESVLNALL